MIACARFPCGMTAAGCSFGDCVNNNRIGLPTTPMFNLPIQQPQMGCICPPTSEKTCESPICPRKNHLSAIGSHTPPHSTEGKTR